VKFRLFFAAAVLILSSASWKSSEARAAISADRGGTRDLDDIGNRNVGCGRGLGNWYSIEKQIAMGRSYAQKVESTTRLVNDPLITEYTNRVGQNLVRNAGSQVPFTIRVIGSDDINAFALSGGFFTWIPDWFWLPITKPS
jgi:beta-barrel assembly-enhancing protease